MCSSMSQLSAKGVTENQPELQTRFLVSGKNGMVIDEFF